jgi:hypothetical protein
MGLPEKSDQCLTTPLVHPGGKKPVIDGIGREDIAEARRDHTTVSIIYESVYGGLAGGTCPEIVPCHDNLRIAVARLVEGKSAISVPSPE